MAEVQDEEQWLYGDDAKNDSQNNPAIRSDASTTVKEVASQEDSSASKEPPDPVSSATNGEAAEPNGKSTEGAEEGSQEPEENGEKANENADDDTSSDDEPTVTIGKIVKQPDVMRPPPPTHRAAPTSGLKDEDFNSVGKINGIPVPDYSLQELEEKPWRKPGADLSDYFNYGFTEDTWIKYCERQKSMRIHESGIGLAPLGINPAKGMMGTSNIPFSAKGNSYIPRKPPVITPVKSVPEYDSTETNTYNSDQTSTVNTIQVMTADRRTYSNKVLTAAGQGVYDDMDFGGHPPYGTDFFNTPPPNFYAPPPGPWSGMPPPIPPPGWAPDTMRPPPPMPPPHRMDYFEEAASGLLGNRTIKEERDVEKIRDPIDSRDSRDSRDKESRHHVSRRRSRSRSKTRRSRSRSKSKSRHRRRSRSRSKSRSPSHRHKRKKSKRERDGD